LLVESPRQAMLLPKNGCREKAWRKARWKEKNFLEEIIDRRETTLRLRQAQCGVLRRGRRYGQGAHQPRKGPRRRSDYS